MRINRIPKEGAKTNKYHRIGNGKIRPDFPWTRDKYGRIAKYVIIRIGEDIAGCTAYELTRDFAAQGITPERIYKEFIIRMPWFPDYYLETVGAILEPKVVWDRFHKPAAYDNKAPKGKRCHRSDEHYLSHLSTLRSIAAKAEELYMTKVVISKEDIDKIYDSH
jgi:hypothetical protein